MILLQNDLMTLNFWSENKILEVIYGDLYLLPIAVVKDQIGITMNVIETKGITRVLYDSSKTISQATREEGKEIATFLYASLNKTKVERVARLQSPKFITDFTVKANLKEQEVEIKPKFKFESFTNREEAIEWLIGWEGRLMT